MINFATDTQRGELRIRCPSVEVYPGHKEEKDALALIEYCVEEGRLDTLASTIREKYPKVFETHEKMISALLSVLKSRLNLRVRSKTHDHGFRGYDCNLVLSL
ncbi:MAG: hypothetical protein A2836_02310 [Candidatus Taylorbacteria bacterium RIFCSPHIGHO2_01_FULL_45_63]|uniref:Uncharacterized protein n=1 Tax=Candidatus Taylorbacteria bacterium RIFCSPHIGHO2_02_FULL_45_35 TaxID=1802311 RepID=A0A1G2MQW1_9BACT|nr:MAG: hypothetical protein A2836_02310 [Candidatus Taylorbacteria bacterium RIFCSPHIGHO2_01_FULL_45_63]OHA25411.1 MAG: hypothetical protein A3D56_01350 [Candidatus Taylorbacteria bacterium RIFCSPHIGHO2_02_FULL_45_35]OHA33596.1 MAG: hypothetical protein A3A22_03205 [Candidatus Taylorbacteria bacterium RIFCSPLOWO2_01_FULL_45_34b]